MTKTKHTPGNGFVVFALPRSRTAWLSHFLSYGGWSCGHDEVRRMRSLDDCRRWFSQPQVGSTETAIAPWWRLLREWHPELRAIVIRRSIDEVLESYRRCGIPGDLDAHATALSRLDAKLAQISSRWPGTLEVSFDDLRNEAACGAVFEYALGLEHDRTWWNLLARMNIQISLGPLMKYCMTYRAQIDKLAQQATHTSRAKLFAKRIPPILDGMELSVEPFRTFHADATKLYESHLVATGQHPNDHLHKNIDLFTKLDDLGNLQTLVARCNGRMFGYLVSVLGPSLEAPGMISALHTIFYCDPMAKGLVLRLQRESAKLLSERGIDEILFRTSPRIDDSRQAIVFQRLGAEPFGQLYRLELDN